MKRTAATATIAFTTAFNAARDVLGENNLIDHHCKSGDFKEISRKSYWIVVFSIIAENIFMHFLLIRIKEFIAILRCGHRECFRVRYELNMYLVVRQERADVCGRESNRITSLSSSIVLPPRYGTCCLLLSIVTDVPSIGYRMGRRSFCEHVVDESRLIQLDLLNWHLKVIVLPCLALTSLAPLYNFCKNGNKPERIFSHCNNVKLSVINIAHSITTITSDRILTVEANNINTQARNQFLLQQEQDNRIILSFHLVEGNLSSQSSSIENLVGNDSWTICILMILSLLRKQSRCNRLNYWRHLKVLFNERSLLTVRNSSNNDNRPQDKCNLPFSFAYLKSIISLVIPFYIFFSELDTVRPCVHVILLIFTAFALMQLIIVIIATAKVLISIENEYFILSSLKYFYEFRINCYIKNIHTTLQQQLNNLKSTNHSERRTCAINYRVCDTRVILSNEIFI